MPLKGWFDLNPSETLQAISRLNRQSFASPSTISPDLVQARLNAIKDSVPQESWFVANQHLGNLKTRAKPKRHP